VSELDDGFISTVIVAFALLNLLIVFLILRSVLAPLFGGG
jgi:hypothetical protein